MDVFSKLPPELVITILSFCHPSSVLAFGQTCKPYYDIALDNDLWLEVCFRVFTLHMSASRRSSMEFSLNKHQLRDAGPELLKIVAPDAAKDVANPFFHIYKIHLVGFGWLLGSWVVFRADGSSDIWTITATIHRSTSQSLLYGIITTCPTNPSVNLHIDDHPCLRVLPVGLISRSLMARTDSAGELRIAGYPSLDSEETQTIHPVVASPFPGSVPSNIRFIWAPDGEPRPRHHGTNHYDTDSLQAMFATKERRSCYDDAPYPSPGLKSLFLNTRRSPSLYLPPSPGDIIDWDIGSVMQQRHELLRIRSNFSESASVLLRSGIYRVAYTAGWQYVYVRIRTLTEDDFTTLWPWDGNLSPNVGPPANAPSETSEHIDWSDPRNHLGPFSNLFVVGEEVSDIFVSQEHVRPGARILEVTKITGDTHVPRGQRTLIAFLDDPQVSSDHLLEVEQDLPEKMDYAPDDCPWPVIQDAARRPDLLPEQLLEKEFAPARGIDLPGCGRLAADGFMDPKWIGCTVHVESRKQFSAWWHDVRSVMVFTLLE